MKENTKSTSLNEKQVREDLIAAIDAIAQRGGISRDKALTAWYATAILGIDEDESIEAANVDGAEDAGCDFLYVDEEKQVVYALQGYIAQNQTKQVPIAKWNTTSAIINHLKSPEWFKHSGRNDIYELLQEVDLTDFNFEIGLIALAAQNLTVERSYQAAKDSTGKDGSKITYINESAETLFDKYLASVRSARAVETDTLEFTSDVVEVTRDFGQAAIGAVKASELLRLYKEHKERLFEGNVRLFIGERKGGINNKIIDTAMERPTDFFALNNGITIVTESFKEKDNRKYKLNNFSIVNGCQTTASLCKALERNDAAKDAEVLVRVIAAKKDMQTDIARFNNTQNPVKLSAVRLLDPIQERLRLSFSKVGYNYAPKQEGARAAKDNKKIDLDRITSYLAAKDEDTILDAVTNKSALFDKAYKTIFDNSLSPEIVLLAWLVGLLTEKKRVEKLKEIGNDIDSVGKVVLGVYGTSWGIYAVFMLIKKMENDFTKLTMQKMNDKENGIENALEKYIDVALEAYSETAFSILDSANAKNAIRTKDFLDRLKRSLQLKFSNKAKQKEWKLPLLHNVIK
jgi:hypothetical protein